MSSIPPPSKAGVPTGGNGKYIAVALLLVLGIAGLVIYKVTHSPDDPKQVVAPPPSASGPILSQRIDDVPPPPPEDAGIAPTPTRVVVVNNGGGNACDVKVCNGQASTDLENGINQVARQTRRRCYEKALGNDPSLQGHVTISLRIAANGQVCAATVGSNDMSDTSVGNCAANTFLASHLPQPKGGCVEHLNVPIAYVPAGQH